MYPQIRVLQAKNIEDFQGPRNSNSRTFKDQPFHTPLTQAVRNNCLLQRAIDDYHQILT